jgi:hypothetical protein
VRRDKLLGNFWGNHDKGKRVDQVVVRVHRDALCKSVELRKLSRLVKYRCTKRGVRSLTVVVFSAP